jgi:predicted  nucleic acid-binding Zn-ribbon protein
MNRYEIEEAVASAKQLCTTLRGIQGLIGITEVVLNSTKLVDGLDERKAQLEKEVAALEQIRATKQQKDERVHQEMIDRHKSDMDQLNEQRKGLTSTIDGLQAEYASRKSKLDAVIEKDRKEHAAWMADCANKQAAANDSLLAVTQQINAIKMKLGI